MEISELKNRALSFDRAMELKPIYWGDERRELKGFKAIWNIDRQITAAVVSNRYNLLQHRDFIAAACNAIQNLNIPADARVRDDGNRIYVDISFKSTVLYAGENEEFLAGIRLINSYNATTGVMILPYFLRVICSNGMVVKSFAKGYNIRHTAKIVQDFEGAIQGILNDLIASNEKLKALVNECIADSVEWDTMVRVLNNVMKTRKHADAINDILLKKTGWVFTRWDLYNAFTQYATHGKQLTPYVESLIQTKAEKILTTPLMALLPKKRE